MVAQFPQKGLKEEAAYRKAVRRKTHKERSQPSYRSKYGLLEKKKDYRQRARDFHKKEKALSVLRKKAEEKNPDEFYFAMQNARTRGGIHDGRLTQANKYSQEELALMRTQDVRYLGMKAQQEAKKVERLQSTLHFLGGGSVQSGNSHTVFVDSEREARRFDPEAHFDTPAALLGRAFNRLRTKQLEDPQLAVAAGKRGAAAAVTPAAAAKLERKRMASYREMQQRMERGEKVSRVAQRVQLQRVLAGKGRRSKEAGGENPVFRFKKERKR
ncbi:unnamed protein product [Pedinophyceae sp. YPF-701]|nr:unnamed protein product [Pedinophyceae sp. YPF-701]